MAHRLVPTTRRQRLLVLVLTAAIATQWARAARSGLPRGSIAGFEIGNEPDIYDARWWRAVTAAGRFGGDIAADLPSELTPFAYARDFDAYARVLRRAAPGIPLVGPALANPISDRDWLTVLLKDAHRSLSLVSIHRYPYSGCRLAGPRERPTIARLLGLRATTAMASSLRPLVAQARRYGLPLRLTELNSINCGGRAGISNAFASALWAPDALFALLRAGVSGVNLHVRADAINAPFSLGPRGLAARPLLYGLITFVQALGSDSSLVAVRTRTRRPINLAVWAVRGAAGGLRVLLIDKSWRPARVRLELGDLGPLRIERLIAPSPAADGGVTLSGQRLSRTGQWIGRARVQVVEPLHGAYELTVGKFSAALAVLR
jgi:hypothetical protein